MEKPLLQRIYDQLYVAGKVKKQADFAQKLDYNAGHISTLLKSKDVLPKGVIDALYEKFGISKEYLISNGVTGSMYAVDIKTDNRLSAKKDVNETTLNSKVATLQNPESQTQEYIHMADFMDYLRKEQALREEDARQRGILIESNRILAGKKSREEQGESRLPKTGGR